MNYVSHQGFKAKSTVSRTYSAIAPREARHDEELRALLALALVNGDPIPRMSERQAAKGVHTSRHKLRSARLATVDDVELVKMGRPPFERCPPHARQGSRDDGRGDRNFY